MWKLMNTRKKNHILHFELNQSLGIIAFIKKKKKKMTSFTFPNGGLQYLNDAYRNVTISHTKYTILMIKNIFTYLQYIQKYIYTIHIYIDLFTSRVEDLGH